MTQLPVAGTFSDGAKVGSFQAGLEALRAVVAETPDVAQEVVASVLTGIAEVPSGFVRLDTNVVGTTSVHTLNPGNWSPGQTIKVGTVAPARIVRLVTSGTGDGRIILSGTDTQLDLTALVQLVELKLYLNAGVLEWREIARTGWAGVASDGTAAAAAAAAALSATAASGSATAASGSATAAAGSATAAAGSATAASGSAGLAAGSATEAAQSVNLAQQIAQGALLLPLTRWTAADFPSNAKALAQSNLGKTIFVDALTADVTLQLPPGLFQRSADDAIAFVEICNRTSARSITLAPFTGAAAKPVVRFRDTFKACLDATAGGVTNYPFAFALPALAKGLVVVQVFSLWSGLDATGHEITAAWTAGLSGSLTRDFIYAWTGNAYRVPSYVFTFAPSSPVAATNVTLQLQAKAKLNSFLAFAWAVDETDGLHKIDHATSDTELTQPLPVTSVADFAANELALIASCKRSNSLPASIAPVDPGQQVWSGNNATATQTDPLFVLSGVAGYQERGALNESKTYQGTFGGGGVKHSATQAVLLKPRSGGSAVSSTLSGATTIGPGKTAVVRADPNGTAYVASVSG